MGVARSLDLIHYATRIGCNADGVDEHLSEPRPILGGVSPLAARYVVLYRNPCLDSCQPNKYCYFLTFKVF
jgi:hypothetical protein